MNSKNLASASTIEEIGLTPIVTLVLWPGCLAVGVIGIRTSWCRAPAPVPPAIHTEVLNVEVTNETPALPRPPADHPSPTSAGPPPLPAVAAPSPAIAFAAPLNKPVNQPPAASQNVVRLTFGEGEGKQPDPDYPIEDQFAGHEGTVGIILTVDEDGRVKDAEVATRCAWPSLNQAAIRSVRETWKFRPGPVRRYSVAITYQMKSSN